MNKKDLKEYRKGQERLPWDTGEGFGLIDAHVLADIARQLTRIADAGDDRMISDGIYLSDKAIDKPTPPDALVEAVKDFLGNEICGGYEMPTWDPHAVTLLGNALTAYEKAVT